MALAGLLVACTGAAACAHYQGRPLPPAPDLALTPALTAPARAFWIPGMRPHPFPAHGLDETALLTLAVSDNPDLKAARLQAGVAGAELFAAGLLPDPQISAGLARSALHGGYSLGVAQELQALWLRGPAVAGARAGQQQVRLNILWQEWQVAGRASQLFAQTQSDAQLRPVLAAERTLWSRHYRADQTAMRAGDLTVATTAADLAQLSATEANLNQLDTDIALTHDKLTALLGLRPGAKLDLVGPSQTAAVTAEEFRSAVTALPRRRPDLRALAAGYRLQEAAVREAVLAQFPAVSFGLTRGRDPAEGLVSSGLDLVLTLPVFNRNRGAIAVQRATRAQLRQAYLARLDQAVSDASQARATLALLLRRQAALRTQLPVLEHIAHAARASLAAKQLDQASYVQFQSQRLAAQAAVIGGNAAIAQARTALRVVLALPLGSP